MLDGFLINTQDGRLMLRPLKPGSRRIATANGCSIEVERFALRRDVVLDAWYDASPLWAGLIFAAEDGP